MIDAFPHTPLSIETLPAFRQLVESYVSGTVSETASRTERTQAMAKGAAGAPDVRLAICRPYERTDILPVILQIHGGGLWPAASMPWKHVTVS